jgi:hypothetical protein
MQVIWVKSEPEYFCKRGWTGELVICPTGSASATTRDGDRRGAILTVPGTFPKFHFRF